MIKYGFMNSDSSIDELKLLTKAFISLVEANKGTEIKEFEDWKSESNILSIKIIYNSLTTLYLISGTKFTLKSKEDPLMFIDYLSIMSIVRSALETYLAFYHILANPNIDEETREFRRLLWHASSLSNRQRFSSLTLLMVENQKTEASKLNEMKKKLLSSEKFHVATNISNRTKSKLFIEKGKFDWKPDGGWQALAKEARWNSKFFDDMYNHLSSASHSDATVNWFISNNDNYEKQFNFVSLAIDYLILVVALGLRDYSMLFPKSHAQYSENLGLQFQVDLQAQIATQYIAELSKD